MDLPDNFYDPIAVYVPRRHEDPEVVTIDAGSGIVGTRMGWRLRVHYEGGRYWTNRGTLADRVLHAHGRHVMDAPTTATSLVPVECLTDVGLYYPGDRMIDARDLERIALWIGVDLNDADELARQLRVTR